MKSALILTLITCAYAQQVEIRPPSGGAVFDAGRGSIRPLIGIPGSAFLGDAIESGLSAAWLSPKALHAIQVKDGRTLLAGVESLELLSSPEGVMWSNDGGAAALYSGRELQCVTIGNTISNFSLAFLETDVTAIALRDCSNIAIATADSVYVITSSSAPRSILNFGAKALAFGTDALYAAANDGVYEYRESGSRQLTTDSGIKALAVSRARQLLSLREDSVDVLDLNTGTQSKLALDRAPAALTPLTDSVFLLNNLKSDAQYLTVLDVSSVPAVFFVPAVSQSSL